MAELKKCVILGEANSGKTALLTRHAKDEFLDAGNLFVHQTPVNK